MQRFRGIARSGVLETSDNKHVQREYDFSVSREMLDERFWSEGVVYILPRETFEQGHDDDGNLIDEWASLTQVNPVGKIKISTDDFPYFDDIKELEE